MTFKSLNDAMYLASSFPVSTALLALFEFLGTPNSYTSRSLCIPFPLPGMQPPMPAPTHTTCINQFKSPQRGLSLPFNLN